jgi:1-deoxy-D-xylulose-5-phosphate reductoisomerase
MKRLVVLGSSGSIGIQTLNVVSANKKKFSLAGLSVNKNIEILEKQIIKFKPQAVCVGNCNDANKLNARLKSKNLKTKVLFGPHGLEELAALPGADMVIAAIVGAAGLRAVFKAVSAKKDIAIANKEILVAAGKELLSFAKKNGVKILPVDSEHSAIFQCILGERKKQIKRIILTASGGPFYKYSKNFSKITVKQALAHPTWKMGKKITIDSATLMNKGLEAIEASILFDIPICKVEIAVHPQSIVHSMVEFIDGSVIAQLSNPDMRLPIQYALTFPNRTNSNIKPLDLFKIGKLEFHKPNFDKFPCLNLAYSAAQKGKTFPAVLNAANEIAVEAFLAGKIKFTEIPKIVEKTIKSHKPTRKSNFNNFIEADKWARTFAANIIS